LHTKIQKVKTWLGEGKYVKFSNWKAVKVKVQNIFQLLSVKPVVYLMDIIEKDYQRKEE
jgi:obg-like ATPase 1